MHILRTVFPDRLISRFEQIIWPTRSLFHAVPDYSSGAMLKARYIKHVLPILLTQNSEFCSVCKGSPRKCYSMLWQPFHHDCRSVLNAMTVIYRVSYSDSISWTWNAPDSVNNIFPLCLKKLFNLKNQIVFWWILYYVKIYMSFCTHGHIHLSPEPVHSHP